MIPIRYPVTHERVKVYAILAMDRTGVIGYDNDLIFHNKNDLEFFQKQTIGNLCVMGRKTFESIGKVLPYRQTVIISNQGPELVNRIVKECKVPKNTPTPLVINSYDVQRSLGGLAENLDLHKIYICGGASIYDLMSPFVENWIVTRYNVNVEADGVKKKLLPKNFDPNKLIRVSLPFLNRDWLPMDHGVFQNIQYVVRTYRTGYIPENYDPDTGERKI